MRLPHQAAASAIVTAKEAGIREYVVCENCARAVSIASGEPAFEHWIPAAEVLAALTAMNTLGEFHYAQLTSDGGYIERTHPWYKMMKADPADLLAASREDARDAEQMFANDCESVVGLLSGLADAAGDATCAKTLCMKKEGGNLDEELPTISQALADATGQQAVWKLRRMPVPGFEVFECQSASVNKGSGLSQLCEKLGVSMDRVWAFGDDANDSQSEFVQPQRLAAARICKGDS